MQWKGEVCITITDETREVFGIYQFGGQEELQALSARLQVCDEHATEHDDTEGDRAARDMLQDMATACRSVFQNKFPLRRRISELGKEGHANA